LPNPRQGNSSHQPQIISANISLNKLSIAVFSGLPGTGKTSLAQHAARLLQAPVFSVDLLEAALWRSGIRSEQGSHQAAYEILATLAEGQLRLGQSACVDAVVGLEAAREAWKTLAHRYGAELRCIECVCSDVELHRQRIERRKRNIPGWYELSWADVERSARSFQPWQGERLVVDAVRPLDLNLADLETYLCRPSAQHT
jgi:predicted kinase